MPRISVDGYYRFDNHIIVDVQQAVTRFAHHDRERVSGRRYNLNYALAWDKRATWGYIRPEIELVHLGYDLQNSPLGDDSPTLTTPVLTLDSGLFLERSGALFGDLTQTLEPRIYYLKSNYKAQSSLPDFDTREYTPAYDLLFRNNRFSGGDRIGDANRVTLALTSRFIDNQTGEERFRASIAQAIYLDDRRVTLKPSPSSDELQELRRNQSPLALDLSARVGRDWRLNGEIIYDNHDSDLEKSSFGVRYKDRNSGRLTPPTASRGAPSESMTRAKSTKTSSRQTSPDLCPYRAILTGLAAGTTTSPTAEHWKFLPDSSTTVAAGGPAW